MNNLSLSKDKNLFLLIISFISARLISSLLVVIFLPLYDQRFFTFKDLDFYNQVSSGLFTPNFLFSYLVKFTQYGSETIHSWTSIFICFLISVILYLPWIFLSRNILSKNSAYIYAILVGLHPYLALYSLKFDSTSFAILPVAFYAIEKFLIVREIVTSVDYVSAKEEDDEGIVCVRHVGLD